MKGIAALALVLGLSGCGGEPAAPPIANRASEAPGTDFQAAVAALSEPQRKGVLIRAIRDAGLPCQGVTQSERMGTTGSIWRARCDDGRDHVISIGVDGSAKVSTGAGAARK